MVMRKSIAWWPLPSQLHTLCASILEGIRFVLPDIGYRGKDSEISCLAIQKGQNAHENAKKRLEKLIMQEAGIEGNNKQEVYQEVAENVYLDNTAENLYPLIEQPSQRARDPFPNGIPDL
ncbi:hypothetical protein PT974_08386 [Cladobotryum mycophilum]|uniref:Uncharacterized protein n=1 Tax=Cladobotryum mycophilum TaxID=491253 RepID=A0ABR0SEA8_9HYPO